MSALVWFKRDLRTVDHAPLVTALARYGAAGVRCVYVIEPTLWAQPDASARQWAFVRDSLIELNQALRRVGCDLQVCQGELPDVLSDLWREAPFDALLAHEETGNAVSYQRDLAVARWCAAHGVIFEETPQTGVVRRLRDRDGWHRHWARFMARPTLRAPLRVEPDPAPAGTLVLPTPAALGLTDDMPAHQRQPGGRAAGLAVLEAFLHDRCGRYRGGISSPLSAPDACSRLSPYLAWGCLSMREVVQATEARMATLEADARHDAQAARQHAGLRAFLSRLHWHCHFIQKLESEPELEWRNLHRGYDGLRDDTADAARLAALMAGRTGWPLVDACVAMLRETGWLNFRMRAMLVSVATYPLWLPWRPVGLWLARQFVDYEPGIHWSQMQMQAGTTGINTTRVYNPIKQAHDQDPHGHFVRRWVPALRRVPETWLFEPWRMPAEVQQRCGVRVGADPEADLPLPPVDLESALRSARDRVHAVRARPEVRAATAGIVQRHGSRVNRDGRGLGPRRIRPAPATDTPQLSLEF